MEIQEMIEVLQRAIYVDGKCVNVEIADRIGNNWMENDSPLWNFAHHNYRIKPEIKRVPLTKEDLIERRKLGFEAMWVKSSQGTEYFISGIVDNGVYFSHTFYYYKELEERFTFLDGTPCYKEVNNE